MPSPRAAAAVTPFPAVAIETSVRPASLALARASDPVEVVVLDGDRAHASDLVPALRDLLARRSTPASSLALVVVGIGPGSYTGLRVGGATALGLRLGANAALVGVPSFEAIAWRALGPGEEGVVLRNAFGGHVYGARYRKEVDRLTALDDPLCARPADAWSRWSGVETWIADAPAIAAMEKARGEGCLSGRALREGVPRADALLELGLRRFHERGDEGAAAARPLYLRAFGE